MTPTQPKHTTTEVSEAMVERAAKAIADHICVPEEWRSQKPLARVSLEAALSPGDGVPGMVLGGSLADIAVERRRQIKAEGWTTEHDDAHDKGEMARAAGMYALIAGADATSYRNARDGYSLNDYLQAIMDHYWPWAKSWFKPTTRRIALVKAGALIAAEIDRLDRLSTASSSGRETE